MFFLLNFCVKICFGISFFDEDDFLSKDLAGIDFCTDEVGSASGNFDSSSEGILDSMSTFECWQKTRMNVDDFIRPLVNKVGRQDPHEASQANEINVSNNEFLKARNNMMRKIICNTI